MAGDPEITLKQRTLTFENTRFRVFSDEIRDSNGVEVPNYLVVAPHTWRDDLIIGISVLPVCGDRVVLLKTFRHAIGRAQLEVPRGFMDANEDPAAAALRELLEETGLQCAPDKLISLGFCTPEASTLAARVALFAAIDCHSTGRTPDQELGLGKYAYYTLAETARMLRDMSIEDVTTALTLHRFLLLQNS